MAHGAYLHPLRTIEVAWETDDDGVVVLTGYRDQPPSDLADPGEIVVVHSDSVLSHRYPDSDRSDERFERERAAFLPEADPSLHKIVRCSSSGRSFDQPWTTILAYSRFAGSACISDIEADVAAMKLDGPTLFLGRRGQWWWTGAVGTDLVALDRHPHPENTSLAVFLHEVIDELLSMDGLPSRTLTVFGDHLSADILKEITTFFRGRIDGVERFNPFSHVRSTLNDAAASAVLKRSHMLGCLIGAVVEYDATAAGVSEE